MSFNDLHNLGPLQGAAISHPADGGGCFPATSNEKKQPFWHIFCHKFRVFA
jgi:hypothetical protein